MSETSNRTLRVFLCHSSNDKPLVRELYQKLCAEEWIKPWLDEEELYPGQDWNLEIEKAVEAADAILVCLSNNSITKEGYVQRELRIVLDYADYKPEGTLYIIPVRLEECEPPRRLRPWQYADYFPKEGRERAFQRLLVSLRRRGDSLGLNQEIPGQTKVEHIIQPRAYAKPEFAANKRVAEEKQPAEVVSPMPVDNPVLLPRKITLSNGMEFMRVPAGPFLMGCMRDEKQAVGNEHPRHKVNITYDYWITQYPITNELFNIFVEARGITHPVSGWGQKRAHPVTNVSWNDAKAYSEWLSDLLKAELPADFMFRLPTEAEWEKAARGADGRVWPWGNEFDKNKCNSYEGRKGATTPVGSYSPQGDSCYGCSDMAGNVDEWTHSLKKSYRYKMHDGREDEKTSGYRIARGGSFTTYKEGVCCFSRVYDNINNFRDHIGFRLVLALPIAEIIKMSQ